MEPEGSLPHSQEPATRLYPEPDRSSSCPHPTSLSSVLILASHLRLGLPSGLFPSDFPTKILYAPLLSLSLSHTCYMSCPSQSSWLDHQNNISWGIQRIKPLVKYSPLPCYLVHFRSKYSPQHSILKNPQPTLKICTHTYVNTKI